MNKLQKLSFMLKVDDTLSVFSTHGVAGLTGGLLVGVFANPAMLEYIGTDKDAPGVSITGLLYGNPPHFCCNSRAQPSSSCTTSSQPTSSSR